MENQFEHYNGNPFHDFSIATQSEKWGLIRFMYMEHLPKILEEYRLNKWSDVNFLDWNAMFSPIERIVWSIIRSRPSFIMYPQFPVFNYFIDFADPVLKIGLELDGKEFHDRTTDKNRDEMLLKYGWKIFRASGSLSNHDIEDYEKFPTSFDFTNMEFKRDYEHWMSTTITGLIEAINIFYKRKDHAPEINDCIWSTLQANSLTRERGMSRDYLNGIF